MVKVGIHVGSLTYSTSLPGSGPRRLLEHYGFIGNKNNDWKCPAAHHPDASSDPKESRGEAECINASPAAFPCGADGNQQSARSSPHDCC